MKTVVRFDVGATKIMHAIFPTNSLSSIGMLRCPFNTTIRIHHGDIGIITPSAMT